MAKGEHRTRVNCYWYEYREYCQDHWCHYWVHALAFPGDGRWDFCPCHRWQHPDKHNATPKPWEI
jgi:hypothetical protein